MKVCVIGQGYVGLPLAVEAIAAGHQVVGLETSAARAEDLMAGRSFTTDVPTDLLAEVLRSGRYLATTEVDCIRGFDIAIITVPTPLREGTPDLSYVEAAAAVVGRHLTISATVVLESTSYPGTTEQVVLPILEKHSGLSVAEFHLGFSPERIDPGNAVYTFRTTAKLVAGYEPCCTDVVDAFYRSVVEQTVRCPSMAVAELAKIVENTFRHVNIALVNEMAVIAEQLGISIWDTLDAADTKPYGFMKFTPGPGVGGHCLPIDPAYLGWLAKRDLNHSAQFIELAMDVNARMPAYVVTRAAELLNTARLSVNGAKVLVLGLAYKAGTADVRESPAFKVIEGLVARGAEVSLDDPHVDPRRFPVPARNRLVKLRDYDLVVLLTDHPEFTDTAIAGAVRVLDTRAHFTPASNIVRL